MAAVRAIAGTRHLCLEEGTLSGWLYEVLAPHVAELVVVGVSESRGAKNDKLNAFARAEQLRIGAIPKKVYKGQGEFARLRHLAKAYAREEYDRRRRAPPADPCTPAPPMTPSNRAAL